MPGFGTVGLFGRKKRRILGGDFGSFARIILVTVANMFWVIFVWWPLGAKLIDACLMLVVFWCVLLHHFGASFLNFTQNARSVRKPQYLLYFGQVRAFKYDPFSDIVSYFHTCFEESCFGMALGAHFQDFGQTI